MVEDVKDRAARDRARWVSVGVGSAALMAALLYANRDKVSEAIGRRRPPREHQD